MRCPAIEGIETRGSRRRPPAACEAPVECVAPLLRGLKPRDAAAWSALERSYVECVAPLLRGLKRDGTECSSVVQRGGSRMRCPAIEGIETKWILSFLALSI